MRRHIFVVSLLIPVAAQAEIVERIVAKVNGEIITLSEFQGRQIQEAQAARVPMDRVQAFLRDNNARILQEAIDDMLLVQRAQDTGLRLRPEDLDRFIEDIKKENKITSEEEFQEQLAREGMTLDELKRNMARNILRRQILSRDLESKVMVTDTEVRTEYEARREEYSRPATVTLREILVKGETAQAQARELAAQARAGADFAELARAHSAAPSRSGGGDLGQLARGELHGDLERIAFSLPAGAVSDPVPSGDGYRLLKVEARSEASVVPFEDVKETIRRSLGEARMNKELAGYIAGLRDKAIISVMVREVPQEIAGPAAGQPSGLRDLDAAVEPREEAPPAAPAPADDEEIVTTPQSRPEHVTPAGSEPAPRKDEAAPPPPSAP
jgi:peptidyl-prolyl cis-trans isomerase SurA